MAISEDDRAAYLAGEDRAASLPVAARPELDEMRELPATEATWVEPDPGRGARRRRPHREAAAAGGSPAAATEQQRPRPARGAWFSSRPTPAFGGLVTAALVAVAVVLAGGESRSPQRFAMVVSGTALAPQASGSATLTKTGSGWRIELSAAGLPHEGGRYYEAWLKSPAGVLVPVGGSTTPGAWRCPADFLPRPERHPPARRRRAGVVGRTRAHGHCPLRSLSGAPTLREPYGARARTSLRGSFSFPTAEEATVHSFRNPGHRLRLTVAATVPRPARLPVSRFGASAGALISLAAGGSALALQLLPCAVNDDIAASE